MGQKVDPRWFRVGITKDWPVEWFAKTKSQSMEFTVEDIKIRQFIEDFYKRVGIWKVVIRKTDKDAEIILFTSKPALVIGKEWKKLQEFENKLKKIFNKEFSVKVKEIKVPELSAKIMAEYVAIQLEKRVPHRRVAKQVLQKVREKWAIWVKVQIGGRLWWADMARTEKFIDGRVPLQTLRADIDYYYTTALTKYGILGVKVWIYKGDILSNKKFTKRRKKVSSTKKIKK